MSVSTLVSAFEIATLVIFAGIIGYFVWQSVQARQIQTGLWLSLGLFCMSWLEAPSDNVMYVTFHPEFARMPDWGPFGLTQGISPAMTPPGYIAWFMIPTLVAVPFARWVTRRTGWAEPYTLLGAGFAVGFVWQSLVEDVQASTLQLWTFSRTAPGLTLFPGTTGQVPVTVSVSMAIFVMMLAYLYGRRFDGEAVIEHWVASHTDSDRKRMLATAVAYIAVAHLAFFATILPNIIVKLGGMMTVTGSLQPHGQIPPQPAGPQANGPLGTAILVIGMLAAIVGVILVVRRIERAYASQAVAVSGTPQHA
jgi:hypothetical protein